ncbi:MAG TPA: RNase P subunit p30 family protein [Candidatus Methanofastidiosa archaeon]|nr:RNase P subunit p30 family protein [Candidatus Methanofastidiosa archaeon]HPR40980.1 RNase P subunit p30 family protein [Candidatus Methanofastidiosa archaeon]
MLSNYLAIDLRGIKSDLYEYVASVDDENADFRAVMIYPDTIGRINEIVKKSGADIVFATGNDMASNRRIIENPIVDVMSRPYPIDDTLAKMASRNGMFFEICARDIINSRGYQRSRMIQSLRRSISLARKRKVGIVITSGARDGMELVTPRELVAFGTLVGMEYPEAKAAIGTMPRKILEGRGLI